MNRNDEVTITTETNEAEGTATTVIVEPIGSDNVGTELDLPTSEKSSSLDFKSTAVGAVGAAIVGLAVWGIKTISGHFKSKREEQEAFKKWREEQAKAEEETKKEQQNEEAGPKQEETSENDKDEKKK